MSFYLCKSLCPSCFSQIFHFAYPLSVHLSWYLTFANIICLLFPELYYSTALAPAPSEVFSRKMGRFRSEIWGVAGQVAPRPPGTHRVWVVQVADLTGHVLGWWPGVHLTRSRLFTWINYVTLCKQLLQVAIEVPAQHRTEWKLNHLLNHSSILGSS